MTIKRICDAAVEVLRETDNPAVMFGDSGLLHAIAKRAEAKCQGRAWYTEKAILDALSRTPGDVLVPGMAAGKWGRSVRIFRLPKKAL